VLEKRAASLDERSVRGGFRAPVSARHFPISISAGRRPVRPLTETGSQGNLRGSGGRRHEVHSLGRLLGRFGSGDCAAAINDAALGVVVSNDSRERRRWLASENDARRCKCRFSSQK
jgi:hypothetical protein